jgi:hypothetical protein
MPDALVRLLRSVLAVALLGLGPTMRLADALLYHSTGVPAVAAHQVDDGTTLRAHGDGCLLAVASAPATPAMGCAHAIALAPTTDLPDGPTVRFLPQPHATGPPNTRAPPA